MVAILDRCHACGTRLAERDKFCPKCGVERAKPSEGALEAMEPGPPGGLAWSYRIPIVNNRFTWIRWGWTAFWFGLAFSLPLTALLLTMFGDASLDGVVVAAKLFLALTLIPAAVVLGLGLFAALISGNGLASRTTLTPDGCAVSVKEEGVTATVENVAWLLGSSYQKASNTGNAMSMLLPSEGDAKWAKVRRVEIDSDRHVITLRRRWHNPLRLYVPRERFEEAAAYVREHVPAAAHLRGAAGGPPQGVGRPA